MKKILSCLLLVLVVVACSAQKSNLKDDEIYFFYSNSCPHCHHALEYMNKKYPNLEIAMVNVANPQGYDLLVEAAQKYKLGNNVGTPLITFGDNYIMGWAKQYEAKFDEYCKPYMKK